MMLIDYPPSTTQIQEGVMVPYKGISIKEPAPWVQLWLQQQRQAEDDMIQLYNAVVGKENRDTMAFKQIEAYYCNRQRSVSVSIHVVG